MQVSSSLTGSDDEDEEEVPATLSERIKDTVSEPIEKLKTMADKVGDELKAQVLLYSSLPRIRASSHSLVIFFQGNRR